ncbi:MAG: hypothetical protein DMF85_09925 [Acidobacteria bacterium]|nr:MAG: hypothetical protein DMF85_09925 [Acidobacteriota bacterium]
MVNCTTPPFMFTRRAPLGAILVIGLSAALAPGQTQQPRGVTLADAVPGRRTALVIGNNGYPAMPLKNAVNDARAMAAALQKYGFAVDLATDVTFKELNKRIDRFIGQLPGGDVAMVYYAGHGVQIENENYLVPVDFNAQDEADAKYEAYSASRVVDRLAGSGARLSIVVLDACRNNPFRSSRSGTRGLAPMETGEGTLVAFATAPNRTADDNPGGVNGLFTTYLLDAMDDASLSVEQVFSRARQRVYEASNRKQVPWLVSSVIGEFHFRGAAAANDAPKPAPAPPAPSAAPRNPRVFAPGSSGMILSFIKPDKARDFEMVIGRVKDALARTQNPVRRQQAATWKVFRGVEPAVRNNVLYVFMIDPAAASAEYSETQILTEAFPSEVQALYQTYAAAFDGGQNIVTLQPLASMAGKPRFAVTPPPAAAASNARTFSSDAGLVLNFIKPDKTADFEAVVRKLQQGLAASDDLTRRAQAGGWKVFRCPDPAPNGILYVFAMDPVVKGADYTVSTMLTSFFPNEAQALWKQYAEAYTSGQNWVNLTLVADFGR